MMINLQRQLKFVAVIVIVSVLACGPRVIHVEHPQSRSISPEEAKEIDWQKFKVKFRDVFGQKYKGFLKGWNEDGFIFESYGETETLPYVKLENWMEIETAESQTGKGAANGLIIGLLGTIGIFLLAGNRFDREESHNEFAGVECLFLAPAFFLISVGAGTAIGASSHKYERYYYDREEFRNQPFKIDNADSTGFD